MSRAVLSSESGEVIDKIARFIGTRTNNEPSTSPSSRGFRWHLPVGSLI